MGSTFRVKPYAHSDYKFVVRAKIGGQWKRRYFRTEAEAQAFAAEQNAAGANDIPASQPNVMTENPQPLATGQRRRAIIILGMHRSGTSAIAGALAQAGVAFGNRLMRPAADNPKGFWEHLEIVRLHDRFLRAIGSSWDDERPLPAGWEQRTAAVELQSSLAAVIEQDFAETPTFGLKDPRLSRLLPLWLPLLAKLQIDPHFLLVLREPWEVAQSLLRRNSFSPSKSYLLWLRYTLEAEEATRRQPRTIMLFEQLLDAPEVAFQRIIPHLGAAARSGDAERAFREFPERQLQHHHVAHSADTAGVPQFALTLYKAFADNVESEARNREVDAVRARFTDVGELFHTRVAELDRQARAGADQVASLQRQNLSKSHRVTILRQRQAQHARELSALRDALAEKAADGEAAASHLHDARWEVLTLRAALLRNANPAADSIASLAEAENRAEAANAQRDQLRGMVLAMERDLEQERLNVAALQQRYELAAGQAAAAEDERNEARRAAAGLREQLASRDQECATALGARDGAEAKMREVEQALYAAEDRLNLAQTRLDATERRAAASEDQLQTIHAQWQATQEQLRIAGSELAARRKQINQLRERLGRRLILPFGKAQQRIEELTR